MRAEKERKGTRTYLYICAQPRSHSVRQSRTARDKIREGEEQGKGEEAEAERDRQKEISQGTKP